MPIKIPPKLYVTYQRREKNEPRLGFASPYEKGSAFEKRKRTQDKWAYGYGYYAGRSRTDPVNFEIQEDETVVCTKGDGTQYFILNCYPEILENTPLDGFEISKEVRRGSGWNGGNVVWRVRDPRDFELEISSSNMAKLLDVMTIDKGKILGKCCWAREGANNVLLPEDSDEYRDGQQTTKSLVETIKISELSPGCKVTLISKDYPDQYTYLGQFYFVGVNQTYQGEKETRPDTLADIKVVKKPLYVCNGEAGKFFFSATSKIKEVFKGDKINVTDVVNELYTRMNNLEKYKGIPDWVFAVSDKRIDPKKFKISTKPTKVKKEIAIKERTINSYSKKWWDRDTEAAQAMLFKMNNSLVMLGDIRKPHSYYNKKAATQFGLVAVNKDELLKGYLAKAGGQAFDISDNFITQIDDPEILVYEYEGRSMEMRSFPAWVLNPKINGWF